MKPTLYLFACVGAVVMALYIAGSFGIGYFRLYYGVAPVKCFAAGYGT
ncbi:MULTISPECIES: hypothetical protein [Burkholderia]|nr:MULTISPECIES: hypothetical protein [Burkholderia]